MSNVQECSKTLSGSTGGKYDCKSKVDTGLEVDGCILKAELYIVEDGFLLSRDILCREG